MADIVTEENAPRWLIDQFWGASAVGVIGGAPKCSKTWLALDMSLSVATGTACLDRYEVPQPGPVTAAHEGMGAVDLIRNGWRILYDGVLSPSKSERPMHPTG